MGGDVNQQDESGWTALMEASSWGYHDIVHCLVEKGADVMYRTRRGKTALDIARQDGQPEIADYLLAQGAKQ